jgi:hypothetical protein
MKKEQEIANCFSGGFTVGLSQILGLGKQLDGFLFLLLAGYTNRSLWPGSESRAQAVAQPISLLNGTISSFQRVGYHAIYTWPVRLMPFFLAVLHFFP